MDHYETPRQNPFSLYDFIGYLIPGAIFIFLLLIFDVEESTQGNDKSEICTICNFLKNLAFSCEQSALHAITSLFFFFVVAYVLGQIISILSNFIIEESLFCRHHNYFSYILLDKGNSEKIIRWIRFNFYDFLLLYVFIWEWFFGILSFFSFPCSKSKCCCSCYIYKKIRFIDPLDEMRADTFKKTCNDIVKGFYKIKEKNNSQLFFLKGENIGGEKNNFFDLVYHYVVERATHHLYKIQNYVALYGFMRNLSMAFCLLFWITVIALIYNFFNNLNFKYYHLMWWSLILYSFFGFVTMIGIHKYKRRFTIEVFQAASALKKM